MRGFKPVPDSFVEAVQITVFDETHGVDTVVITATHPEREGYCLRRTLKRTEAAKLAMTTPPGRMEPEGAVLRHGPDAERLIAALWALGDEAEEESFANAPVSIGTLRASRDWNASHWKPRDVLIDTLRRMDGGEYQLDEHVDALVIAWRRRAPKEGEPTVREISSYYSAASPDIHVTLGVLDRTVFMIQSSATD